MTGGGALLSGLDQLISENLKVPVMVAEHPLNNVAQGAGILLEHMQKTAKNKK
ncbi:Rod shape-determining protein MreB [Lactiplantibacillus plantarum]|nr:Rod shape-determining protein MreB [Lactiplantibacillus plantarum]